MDLTLTINDDAGSQVIFRNADGSGWMRAEDWDRWKAWMSGDATARDRGRRHKSAFQAWAAALITGASPGDAEDIATQVLNDEKDRWGRAHGWGKVKYQWAKHLPIQHYAGTVALAFVPWIGPVLSGVASNMTPMVIAASKKALSNQEGDRVSGRFRQEYYNAIDQYLEDPEGHPLPVGFLEYQQKVVIPAARAVKDQIRSGSVKTATGVYPLDVSGFDLWRASRDTTVFEDYSGPWGQVEKWYYGMVYDIYNRPKVVLLAAAAGAMSGFAAHLALKEK